MKSGIFITIFFIFTSFAEKGNPSKELKSNSMSSIEKDSVEMILIKVANWQMEHEKQHHMFENISESKLWWPYGTFFTGLMKVYEITNDEMYIDFIYNAGETNRWHLAPRPFHADAYTVAQAFIEIYMHNKNPKIIEDIKWLMDMHLKRNAPADVRRKNNDYSGEWWTWCDALYMAPPAFARMAKVTGEEKYLDYMDKHWWITSDYLYDKKDHLFYRDDNFFHEQSKNGKKIFWSRGNGWVFGGLVRVLDYMPKSYSSRKKYIRQYKEMAEKLVSIQGGDGLWRSSLLDPDEFPIGESSGSAFFCYGLAWGINNGILNKEKYLPVVEKVWKALVNNVNEDGRLGYVQQIGDRPENIKPEYWEHYGSGAFLLAGSEILKLVEK